MFQFSLRCFNRRSVIEMAGSYKEAVFTLNTLQSNAETIKQVQKVKDSQRHLSLQETLRVAGRAGLTIQDIDKLSIIHISGTKGKGSTCAFTESILRAHGFKTGFYSSPHLVEVRERIRVNGKPLSQEDFSRYFWECYNPIESTKNQHNGNMPTYFRFLTVMAFHVFIEEKVDVAIFEVGIGGAYDCTNIVRYPVVCGVSSLGMDHTSILGDTIEKIAWHKAGIFKSPLHVAPVLDVCSLKIELGIQGNYQASNASLALQLSNYWLANHAKSAEERSKDPAEFQITPSMAFGLKSCKWPGRNQKVIGENITYYLDGAHTDASIKLCAEWFKVETTFDELSVGGPVARVLLFNSTGDRRSDVLLGGLLDSEFDCAVFCPNIQQLVDKQIGDVRDAKVTLESQMKRRDENHATWLSLLRSPQRQDKVSSMEKSVENTPQNGVIESSSPVIGSNNDRKSILMPTKQFDCIADSLFWISQGQEHRLPSDVSIPLLDVPHSIKSAKHVFVLCTGSLHLVGDVLSLLDPHTCLK